MVMGVKLINFKKYWGSLAVFGFLLILIGRFIFGIEFTGNTSNPTDLFIQNLPPAIGWGVIIVGFLLILWAIGNRKR